MIVRIKEDFAICHYFSMLWTVTQNSRDVTRPGKFVTKRESTRKYMMAAM